MFKHGAIWKLCALSLLVLPGAALAHHSLLTYDVDEIVEIEGEVTDVFWRNPHVQLTVRAVDDDGGERSGTVEGSPSIRGSAGYRQAVAAWRKSVSAGPLGSCEDDCGSYCHRRPVADGLIDADSAAALGLVSKTRCRQDRGRHGGHQCR